MTTSPPPNEMPDPTDEPKAGEATQPGSSSDAPAAPGDQEHLTSGSAQPAEGGSTAAEPAADASAAAAAKEVEAEIEAVESEAVESEAVAAQGDEAGVVEPVAGAEAGEEGEELQLQWYILKVQVNREDSIRDALWRRVKMHGLEQYFDEVIVPTEDVAEFTKAGKRRIVKRKLFPGYLMVHMAINDDTWFAVRETPGIGDFTGAAGKPTPMEQREVERYTRKPADTEEEGQPIKTSIPFKPGDRVRVKEGYFQNFEGEVETVDETHGRVTVMINIFGRPTPVELEHWQMESV